MNAPLEYSDPFCFNVPVKLISPPTVNPVKVPTDVIFDWAAVVTVAAVVAEVAVDAFPVKAPTKAVDVIEVAPITIELFFTFFFSRYVLFQFFLEY